MNATGVSEIVLSHMVPGVLLPDDVRRAGVQTPVDSLGAMRIAERLFREGINVQPMVAPAVPEHQARLRFFVASTHTVDAMDAAVKTIARVMHTSAGNVRPSAFNDNESSSLTL